MFKKVLIADRGEIVLRIARTCERAGIATVAVHAASEATAPYVTACDEAVCVDIAPTSPLDASTIIEASKKAGADAIHPGCGALCLDIALAKLAREAGLQLIGPDAEVLARCSDRTSNQELARLAGIRPLASIDLNQSWSRDELLDHAREIGYPLWLKTGSSAAEPLLVEGEEELPGAIDSARAVSGDAALYLECWLDRPRLLAVQVVADARASVALGDLEHSLELDGRTLLEESPAPAFMGPRGERKRAMLREAAICIVREAGLVGLATAEFLLDPGDQSYFVGLRPGLAIEHTLCEMCTGLDLVELQIALASGQPLSPRARTAEATGHAIEGRVYAEDPMNGSIGVPVALTTLRWPTVAPGSLRIETELAAGANAPTDRDPLVAKIAGYGRTRHQAILTLDRALAEAVLEPLATNIQCLRDVLADESFRTGHYDNEFVPRLKAELKTRT